MKNQERLALVRKSLEDYFQGRDDPPKGGSLTGEGLFVTLHQKGDLRGCIGCLEGREPLEKLIYRYARSAAFEDPRFPPVVEEELKLLEIEITILSPFQQVKDLSEIRIGVHGLYLQKGYRSGLFLPQVPVEQKWDLQEYLNHLCTKAGLPPGAWEDKEAELFRFTGEIQKED